MKKATGADEPAAGGQLGQGAAMEGAQGSGDGRDLEGDHYVVEISYDDVPAQLQCRCGACPWVGTARSLCPIDSCSLTPGDPSPAGRCPDCDALAYLANGPLERMTALLTELLAYEAERFEGSAEDLNVSGADLVDWFTEWRERAKELLHVPQCQHPSKDG